MAAGAIFLSRLVFGGLTVGPRVAGRIGNFEPLVDVFVGRMTALQPAAASRGSLIDAAE
jgi:hypothetical protein